MAERWCSNCVSCVVSRGGDDERIVRCNKGMWSMPHMTAKWLDRFKYLPINPGTGFPLAQSCPMFESSD